jgi:L-iditol 2-dehydrogenase
MLTTHLLRPEHVELEEAPVPKPQPGEALIHVKNVGICGSDIHAYYGKHPYIDLPIIQGHEFSGEIATLGSGVKGPPVGTRVTVVPMLHCRQCKNCRNGDYNRCAELKFIGCQTTGAMAEFVVVPEDKIIPLPDSIDDETGALIEPLAVGLHGANIGKVCQGSGVVIMGAGTIGLMTTLAVRALGASVILQTDLEDSKLAVASKLGADHTVNISNGSWQEAMQQAFGREGPDIMIECAGVPAAVQNAVKDAPRGCRIVLVGVYPEPQIPVNLGFVQDHELELRGVAGYTIREFRQAIDLVKAGKITVDNLKGIISARYPLKQAAEAYTFIESSRASVLKVMLAV